MYNIYVRKVFFTMRFYFIAFFLIFVLSCKGSVNEKDKNIGGNDISVGGMSYDILDCEGVKRKVERCLKLHLGALDYIEGCGEKSRVDIAKMKSCEEVVKYVLGQE